MTTVWEVNVEPLDIGEDLWWVFYLEKNSPLVNYKELINRFAHLGIHLANEHVDNESFETLLYDGDHNIYLELLGSADTIYPALGVSATHVVPPTSPVARINADLFIEYGKVCYQLWKPLYAFAENLNTYIRLENVSAYRLTHVCWAQFFGPDFVRGFGRETLVNAPAWRNENLGDGGLLYILAATPYLYQGAHQYWQQARDYLKRYVSDPIRWSDSPE